MTEERKRLFISIGAAVLLHAAVLILTGMHALNFESRQEFGPITVEISMERSVDEKQPEPEPVEDLADRDVPDPVGIPEKPAVEQAVEQVKEPVREPVPPAAPAVREYTPPPSVPDDTIASILSRRTDSAGVNAVNAFGDDKVAPTTDRPDTWAASESAVVLSDVPAPEARFFDDKKAPVETSKSLIDSSALSSLDAQLASGASASGSSPDSRAVQPVPSYGTVSGKDSFLVFDEPSAFRKLLKQPEPDLPEYIQYGKIQEYKVVIVIEIDSDGLISSADFLRSSGDSRVDAAMKDALRGWLFEESGSLHDKKVRATLTYIIKKS